MVDLPSLHPNRPPEKRRRRELAEIIEARVEEIFLLAREKIEKTSSLNDCHAGVVLTGGSSMLEGVATVAERVFDAKCRVGFPQGIGGMAGVLASPIYSTGVGLLSFSESDEGNSFAIRTGLWGRLLQGCIDAYA
jgi:cell division protein FtsA